MRALTVAAIGVAVLSGCGESSGSASTATTSPASTTAPVAQTGGAAAALAACGAATGSGPASAFPAGLLPSPSKITAPTFAYVGLSLRDTLNALKANSARLGYTIDGQDYEGIEAELELTGSSGDVSVQLKPAAGCRDVTRVQRTSD